MTAGIGQYIERDKAMTRQELTVLYNRLSALMSDISDKGIENIYEPEMMGILDDTLISLGQMIQEKKDNEKDI